MSLASSITPERLSSLLSELYGAAENPLLWTKFLNSLADLLGASYGMIVISNTGHPESAVAQHGRCDPQAMVDYNAHWNQHDVWLNRNPIAYRQTGVVCASQSVASNCIVEASEFYNEFLKNYESFQNITGTVYATREVYSLLSMHYRKNAGGRTREELATVELLMPHVQRAVSMHRALSMGGADDVALRDGVDRLSTGMLLISGDLDVIWMNNEAERIARTADGMTIQNRRIRVDHAQEAAAIAREIRVAVDTTLGRSFEPNQVATISRPSGQPAFQFLAFPLSRSGSLFNAEWAAAVVLLADPSRRIDAPTKALSRVYGLTRQEARIAAGLLDGMTPLEIADDLELSTNTVRTHLKSIYSKAAVRGQGEFVRKALLGLSTLAQSDR